MQKYQIIWSKPAEFDLENIIENIKLDSINIAKEIFFSIKKECNNLYYFPERKRVVPELQAIGINKYREIIYKRWRIIFKIEGNSVYVLLVADSRQNLENILFQRLISN